MELKTHEAIPFVFYVLPQMRQVNRGPLNNEYDAGANASTDQAFDSLDAAVALLADDRDNFAVELLHVPDGLATEPCRSHLDRLNWSSCKPVSSSSLEKLQNVGDSKKCANATEDVMNFTTEDHFGQNKFHFQLNGEWVDEFSW
ncbi:unnamed protein product [Phytomonas sp. Hart1]|nr:unnamed protein product [Phytomonas sp. Hart1]|eukprot:CCW67062.1 unnamed protein product [Phytomonas sp. isolate Hart1]